MVKRSGGGIGRHAALKMLFPDGSVGSIPAPSTRKNILQSVWQFEINYICL